MLGKCGVYLGNGGKLTNIQNVDPWLPSASFSHLDNDSAAAAAAAEAVRDPEASA